MYSKCGAVERSPYLVRMTTDSTMLPTKCLPLAKPGSRQAMSCRARGGGDAYLGQG